MAPLAAFPGVEGFGRLARGGRGGEVYHLTTLSDAGPDSLREGIVTAKGPRTIVFDTGGGTHDLRRRGDFTLQWCIISEALASARRSHP